MKRLGLVEHGLASRFVFVSHVLFLLNLNTALLDSEGKP